MSKIKAFTLTEIIVVMIISTMVISLAFAVLKMVHKQTNSIKKIIKMKENIQVLERLFWKDFNEFGSAELKGNQLFFTNLVDSVSYKLDNKMIIRNNDSIHLVELSSIFYLDGEINKQGAVDAIKVNFKKPFSGSDLFVFGHKDACFYLNQ